MDSVLARVSEATGVPADLLGGFLSVLAASAATGRLPARADMDALRECGALAAERGIPLRVLADACLHAAEITAGGAFGAVRRGMAAYIEGYEEAQRAALRQEEEARRLFVDDLLQGRADAERAEHFGLRLAGAYVVTVARPGTPMAAGDPLAGRIEQALVARFGSHNILVAVRDGLLVCVAPGALTAASGEFTHHVRSALTDWRVGVGRPHKGPGGIVTSYREAVNAIDLGGRLGLRAQVLKAADLLVFLVLLRDRDAIVDLVSTVLGPLTSARGGPEPLLETLEAIFASQGNHTAAARRLGVSTRAITYRLERIRRLTGFSPSDPTQRFTLETAVLGARLLEWPAHPLT
ncbi:PucR family transcriptional regulator [Microbispora sp. SCL1-1]|uniref:PucR family transcriptional regulator n=1 Tax=unclassified Microbispora TaxID=2614687 RepID=UPI001157BC55|nr:MULTISPECIES: helix-turn-helix domain-containing protein [unclassified Microbispora]NJP27680.1 PucR family transcriptional regulator [Microbispora sp. CL1-1]TQS10688.1 PucR family transcriptional regulator [Microbispora sp. SCL1-1]